MQYKKIYPIIKFRGKRKDNGEWVYGDFLGDDEIEHVSYIGSASLGVDRELKVEVYSAYSHIYAVDSNTVGQYTNEHDKNGKEIYAGDIVKIEGAYQDYFIVEYNGHCFTLFDGKDGILGDYIDWERDLEVVGNIHDNKDLYHAIRHKR